MPSRACSTSSTGSRRRPPGEPVKGEIPPGFEATFRYSLVDPNADVAAEAAAFRPAFAHLALLVQIPGVDVRGRVEAEKGSPLTERELAILDERVAAARAWLEAYAPERARLEVRHDRVPPEAAGLDRDQRAFLAALADAAAAEAAVGTARPGSRPSSRPPRRPNCPPAGRLPRSTWRSSDGPTGRARAGSWPVSNRHSSLVRLREAAEANAVTAGGGS